MSKNISLSKGFSRLNNLIPDKSGHMRSAGQSDLGQSEFSPNDASGVGGLASSCPPQTTARGTGPNRAVTWCLIASAAIVAMNLYSSQPLLRLIGPDIGISSGWLGLVPTATMLGYSVGLVLLVPLLDLIENRRLIVTTMLLGALALCGAASATSTVPFLGSSFALGVGSSVIHMLVPTAAYAVPEDRRGRIVGLMQSGIVVGVLFARPVSGFVAALFGWRTFYVACGLAMFLATGLILGSIPRHEPALKSGFRRLIMSLWTLLTRDPVLQRRTAYQVLCMAAFAAFWTVVPLRLAAAPFNLGGTGIAVFALVGAGGIFVAPVSGWAGDRSLSRVATFVSHGLIIVAFPLAGLASWLHGPPGLALAGLALSAICVDAGFIGDQTLGRRAINLLRAESRGRVNGLFTGILFIGGAFGAAVATPLWTHYGWSSVCLLVGACGALALALSIMHEPGSRP